MPRPSTWLCVTVAAAARLSAPAVASRLLAGPSSSGVAAAAGLTPSERPEGCPHAYDCRPSPCDVENSNHKPGHECACTDSFDGVIAWQNGKPKGSCTPADCDVANSNGKPGLECKCANGYRGTISWQGNRASGSCVPAPCDLEMTNKRPGRACECDSHSRGTVAWIDDVPTSNCYEPLEDVIALFYHNERFPLPTYNAQGSAVGQKELKCCVNSNDLDQVVIQDITAHSLPSVNQFGLEFMEKTGCGRMFGVGWHSAHSRESGGKCEVRLSKVVKASGLPRHLLIPLLDRANDLRRQRRQKPESLRDFWGGVSEVFSAARRKP